MGSPLLFFCLCRHGEVVAHTSSHNMMCDLSLLSKERYANACLRHLPEYTVGIMFRYPSTVTPCLLSGATAHSMPSLISLQAGLGFRVIWNISTDSRSLKNSWRIRSHHPVVSSMRTTVSLLCTPVFVVCNWDAHSSNASCCSKLHTDMSRALSDTGCKQVLPRYI